jgi:hypothetical protein
VTPRPAATSAMNFSYIAITPRFWSSISSWLTLPSAPSPFTPPDETTVKVTPISS